MGQQVAQLHVSYINNNNNNNNNKDLIIEIYFVSKVKTKVIPVTIGAAGTI
jgi:hypothetical protein